MTQGNGREKIRCSMEILFNAEITEINKAGQATLSAIEQGSPPCSIPVIKTGQDIKWSAS